MTANSNASAKDGDGNTYVLDVAFEQPVEAVWAAITQKQLIDQYYFSAVNADITQVGAEIFYGAAEHKLITGRVVALEAPRLLKHTFRFAEEADTSETIVTYALAGDGTGPRLHLEHHGYAANLQGYADIAGGWPIIVGGLKGVLEKK